MSLQVAELHISLSLARAEAAEASQRAEAAETAASEASAAAEQRCKDMVSTSDECCPPLFFALLGGNTHVFCRVGRTLPVSGKVEETPWLTSSDVAGL